MLKPVVVYAASGYTGRLTCEWLTKLGVPFVAAGRNQQRLDAVADEMRSKGADCEAVACAHTPEGLRGLFRGRKVAINISGPFSLLGYDVVQAALDEGVHYVDITGEQDFMFDLRRDYGPQFAAKKLVLAPSASYLWAPGAAAAEVCLETPGIDTIDSHYAPTELQTVASLQSMFRAFRRANEGVRDGARKALNVSKVHVIQVPTRKPTRALCVGAGEATFLCEDPRVKNCNTYFVSEGLVRAVGVFKTWNLLANRVLNRWVPGEALDAWSDKTVLKFKKDPPAEQADVHKFVNWVVGTGGGKTVRVTMHGTSQYVTTGFIAAMTAQEILQGKAQRFGYVSVAQTLGARHLLERLKEMDCTTTIEVGDAAARSAAA
jgi:short subunit dehydrogenase-like uncharacterized protein